MSEQIEQMSLPPGWDCKYDARTGRYYYVNLFTKTTTWEDPRARFRQLQTGAPLHISNDNISVQPVHGSPYHVYPSSNSFYPAQQAFQNPPSGVPSLTASPNLATKLQQQPHPIELSPMVRSSPHTPRMGLGRHAMQETSFSNNVSAADTDATVIKINSMFPTVPETHIRMLLKKYLKSFFPKADEDLILDVLANADNNVQSASQQLIKLGYEKRESPANQRGSSRKGSEKDGQSAADAKRAESQTPIVKPKTPEEKKKIKARLQAKYKDIAERIILMALESVDYSEDRAKQILNIVIQEDKEKKKSVKIDAPHKPEEDKENAQGSSSTPSRNNSTSSNHVRTPKKTVDEHPKPSSETENGTGTDLEPSAAENENVTPDTSIEITTSTTTSTAIINDSPQSPLSQQLSGTTANGNNQPPAAITGSTDLNNNDSNSSAIFASTTSANKQPSRARAKADHAKYSIFRSSSSEDELDGQSAAQKSISTSAEKMTVSSNIPRIASKGPNAKLFKGPNDDLLLADYVTWNGANPDLAKGSQKLALGPDRSIRLDRGTYKARGPNADLCKGPVAGLTKGSMYAQLNCSLTDVKCN